MKIKQPVILNAAFVLLAFCLGGCFNEPEPAYRTARPETRVYLKDAGLQALSVAQVYEKGMVFVGRELSAEERAKSEGAASDGVWTNLSAVVSAFEPRTLEYLNLDRNALTNVDELVSFTSLKWLRLNGNRLTALPDLKGLRGLRRIYLQNNRLTAVPETLRDLPSLTDVELSGNPIDTVPAWLAEKPGLKNISLNRTRVTSLPKDLSAWRSLSSLQLGDLSVPAEEMARIRKELPNVAIVF